MNYSPVATCTNPHKNGTIVYMLYFQCPLSNNDIILNYLTLDSFVSISSGDGLWLPTSPEEESDSIKSVLEPIFGELKQIVKGIVIEGM